MAKDHLLQSLRQQAPQHQAPGRRRSASYDPRRKSMDLGLKGKHAIVTGGSQGIGKAIARELAREGVDVAIVSRNKDSLEAAAKELSAETGGRVIAVSADVTKKEQVEAMVAKAVEQ